MNEEQIEEIEALKSIYLNDFEVVVDSYSMKITNDIKLFITLNSSYPSENPPTYELLAPTLTKRTKQLIAQEFDGIYLDNLGQPILFQWIEKLKDIVENERDAEEDNKNKLIGNDIDNKESEMVQESSNLIGIFNFCHGPLIQDRKSTFQGHFCSVTNESDIKSAMDNLLENRKIAHATHNISAYRIEKGENSLIQDCEDDGETHAGGRLLHLLQILNLKNVLVVVSRWYGGIHLGPDRFRHINNAARQVLEQAGIVKK